jgi:hypothetical protein
MDELFQLPNQILTDPYLTTYNKDIETIWWEIVKLNSIVFVLSKISKFNFNLFASHLTKDHFWQILLQTHYESCLLSLWKIEVDNAFDKGKTLNQIRNEIIINFKSNHIKQKFIAELKKKNFEKVIGEISEKVKLLRHNIVAHLNFDGIPQPKDNKSIKMKFEEINFFTMQINDYFKLLCFGNQKSVIPIEYDESDESNRTFKHNTDIEEILDTIVRESHLIQTKLHKPEEWKYVFPGLPKNDKEEIEYYLKKLGL